MPDLVSRDEFARCLDSAFRIELPAGNAVGLVLKDVTELVKSPGQETFSITFIGPSEPLLPQGIYPLWHDRFGLQELFIVPVAGDERGISYQAVFNRLVEASVKSRTEEP